MAEDLLAYLQKSRSTEEKSCDSLKKPPNLQHVEQAVSTPPAWATRESLSAALFEHGP